MGNRAVVAVVLSALARGALAAPPKAAAPPAVTVEVLASALGGPDRDAAIAAAHQLGDRAEPAAHEALLDALAWGVAPAVAQSALAALASHPAPPDVGVLARYATHRDPAVRAAALDALAGYPDPVGRARIVAALHDPDATARSAAARSAARAHLKAAIDPLLALLALGDDDAGAALAELADAALVRQIGDQLGKVPDVALAKCLGAILARADFGPDAERVEVVRALARIDDAEATQALSAYVARTPATPPRPSRAEAQQIVGARTGGGS